MIKRILKCAAQLMLYDYVRASSCSVFITDRTINANASIVLSFAPSDGLALAEGKYIQFFQTQSLGLDKLTFQFATSDGFNFSTVQCIENLNESGISTAFNFSALCDKSVNAGKCPICSFSSAAGLETITVTNLNSSVNTLSYNVVLKNYSNPMAGITMTDPICSSYVGTTKTDTVTPFTMIPFQPIASSAVVTLSSNPPTNGNFSVFTSNIKLTQPIPKNGAVRITLPYCNKDFVDLGIANNQSMFPASVSTLTATASFIDASNVAISLGTVTIAGNSSTQEASVYFTNASVLPKDGTLTTSINSLYNAPSFFPLTGFTLETGLTGMLQDGSKSIYLIESVSNSVLTNTKKADMDPSQASGTVNPAAPPFATNVSYVFQVVTINTIPKGGYFTLTVPASVTVPGNSVTSFTITCNLGCTSTNAVITWDSVSKLMKFAGLFPLNSGLGPNATLKFTVKGWTNPTDFTPAMFTWTSYAVITSVPYAIDNLTPLSITASVGVCTITSAVPSDGNSSIYATPTSYSITMKCDSKITSTYQLTLTWPAEFLINNGACIISGLNNAYSCTATSSTREVLIKTFTDTSIASQTNFTFSLTGIRNPGSLGTIGSVLIKLVYTGFTTDQGTYDYPDTYFTAGKILAYTITPVTARINLNPDTYKFVVQPAGDIPQNAYLSITMPADISGTILGSCGTNLVGFGQQISCSVLSKVMKISSGFPSATAYITQYSSTTQALNFDIAGFINPATLNSGVWAASISDSQNKVYFTWDSSTSPVVVMREATCTITSIIPLDKSIYTVTSYTFNLFCMQAIDTNTGVEITFPGEFYIAVNSNCIVTGQSQTYTCSSTGNIITIIKIASAAITNNTNFSFSVNSIRNPGNLTGLTAIKLRTMKSDRSTMDTATYTISDGVFLSSVISSFIVTPASYVVQTSPSKYVMTLTPLGDIPAGTQIKITLPLNGPTLISNYASIVPCANNLTTPGVNLTCSVSGSIINVSGFQATAQITQYTSVMIALQIEFNILQNPATTAKSSALSAQINSSTGVLLYKWNTLTEPTVQMNQGICTINNIQPTGNSKIYAFPSSFGFSVTCMQALTTFNGAQIIMPTEFMLKDGQCTIAQQNTFAACTAVASTGIITISNLPLSNIPSNTNWSFTVTNIRNPTKFLVNQVTFSTTNSNGTILDSGVYTFLTSTFSAGSVSSFTVTPSSGKVLNTPVNYELIIMPAGDLPSGNVMKLTLPIGVTIGDVPSFLTYCGDGDANVVGGSYRLSCSINGQEITVNGIKSTQQVNSYVSLMSVQIIKLQYLTNPPNTSPTAVFNLSFYDATNKSIFTWDDAVLPFIQMTQGIIIISSITAANTGIFEPTVYTFIIKHMVTLNPTDKLVIQFPNDFYVKETFACNAGSFNSASLTCKSNDLLYTIVLQNMVTTAFPSVQFSFTVDSIRNPGVIGALVNPIIISTTKDNNTPLDSGSYIMPTNYFTVGNIPNFDVLNLQGGISTSPADYTFKITPKGSITKDSSIKIVLPLQIPVANPTTFVTQTILDPFGFGECALCKPVVTLGADLRTIKIINGFVAERKSITLYNSVSIPIQFTLKGFTNPPSTTTTGAFNVSIIDSNNIEMYQWRDLTKPTVTLTQGVCTSRVIRPVNADKIYFLSTFEFTMTCMQDLIVGSKLEIIFPIEFLIFNSNKCTIEQISLGFVVPANSGYTCVTDYNTRKLTISNFMTQTYTGGQEFSVYVSSFLIPGVIGKIGLFQIKSYNNLSFLLDSGTYDFQDDLSTPNVITKFLVQTLNQGLNQTPVTYRFSITPTGDVLKDSLIKIFYPVQVSIPNTAAFEGCAGTIFSGIKDKFFCSVHTGNEITIHDAFKSGPTQTLNVPDATGKPPDLIFELIGFQNPSTTETTGPFSVQIVDKVGVLNFKWLSATEPVLSASGILNPLSAGFFRTNSNNGAITDYTFNIVPLSIISTGTIVRIVLPLEVKPTSTTTCIGNSKNLDKQLDCTVTGQTVEIIILSIKRRLQNDPEPAKNYDQIPWYQVVKDQNTAGGFLSFEELHQFQSQFAQTIGSGTAMQFTIKNLINPTSFKPTLSIQYFALNASNLILEQQTEGMPVVNFGGGSLNQCSTGIVPTIKTLGQTTSYTITITFINYVMNANIIIKVPGQITIPSSVYCTKQSGIISPITCTVNQSTRTITVIDIVTYEANNPGKIVFNINSLVNPSQGVTTDSFSIESQTSDGYPIDKLATNLTIDFRCVLSCQTCSSTYADRCHSCYPTGPLAFFNTNQSTCDGNCLQGATLTTGLDAFTCNTCNSVASAAPTSAVRILIEVLGLISILALYA